MPGTPRAILFDFGNVVATFDYAKACDALGARIGKPGRSLLEQARARGLSPLLHAYETGQVEDRAFAQGFCKLLGIELAFEEFVVAWASIFDLDPSVVQLVQELANQGLTLVLASNTNAIHAAHFRERFATVLALFDHLVFSYEIGHAKPADAFFEVCVQRAGLPRRECVFIDDLEENVLAARHFGIRALLYQDPNRLCAELRQLGLSVGTFAA